MKKFIPIVALCLLTFVLKAQTTDENAIRRVIDKAYIEGLHNSGSLDATRQGFHPGFNLLILRNNMLEALPIYNWIQGTEMRRKNQPQADTVKTVCHYKFIDITGDAAVAKIELHRSSKLIFTDYLSLYRFEEGWRIVGKTYFRHP
jgi:hypothetical protein